MKNRRKLIVALGASSLLASFGSLAQTSGEAVREAQKVIAAKYESGFVPPFFENTHWSVPIPKETRDGAWPMVNMYNRRFAVKDVKEFVRAGPVPSAPLNRVAMLTDYIEPEERLVACPNQDVVYGAGPIALDVTPVVVQVPDFDDRFWVYQIVDLRTDSFVQLGKMYGTRPGFYLLVGPTWRGAVRQAGTSRCTSARIGRNPRVSTGRGLRRRR